MNWRLSRLVLLVILSTGFVIGPSAAGPARTVLAHDDACGLATPAAEGTPGNDATPLASPSAQTNVKTETIVLEAGEDFTITPPAGLVLWVDFGAVTLTVCEGDTIGLSTQDHKPIELLDPGSYALSTASTIFTSGTTSVRLVGTADQSVLVMALIIPPGGALCMGSRC